MKFLHLADLHLGKILQEQSLIEDQEYMLKQIIGTIERENIETVLISGDVYDRSVPPAEAVNLLDSFLRTLIKELKIKVFIIAGNHDSKDRLAFVSSNTLLVSSAILSLKSIIKSTLSYPIFP